MKRTRTTLGAFLRVKHGYAFEGQFFASEGPYILLTPGNFNEEGGFRLGGEKQRYYIGAVPADFILRADDLLVAMTEQTPGLLGSSAWIPESGKYLHNQRLGRIVGLDSSSLLDKRYLYYLFNTRAVRSQIAGSATGTKVRHTAPDRIARVEIDLPSLAEQREIAGILSAYDDLIENNRRRIALLEESARLLYQEWFVRLRFPGHEHTPIVNDIPEGWNHRPLEELCSPRNGIQTGPFGSQLHQADYSDDGVPVVMPKDLISFRVATEGIARIPESLATQLARHILAEGDTVYGRRGDIGRRAFVSRREAGWLCGTGCLRIRPDTEQVVPRFLFDALGTPQTAGTIANRAKGATMLNLNASVLKSVPVLVASRSLQLLYSEQVEPMTRLVAILTEENQKLLAARDLLLPRLMRG